MTRDDLIPFVEDTLTKCKEILSTKGHDYNPGTDDAFANFKRCAEKFGLTKWQAWGLYVEKHHDAILTFVRGGSVTSEPIEGRLLDVINYCLLALSELETERHERNE